MKTLDQYLNTHYSKTAITGYKHTINNYLAYTGKESKTATYHDILNYIGYLRTRKLHPKSLRNHLFAIKTYYNWLLATNQRKDHPCRELYLKDRINRKIPVETLYTKQEMEQFYQTHQTKQKILYQRDKLIISLLICQALTVTEISQLEINNIDLEKATIYIKGTVQTKQRTLNLKPYQIMLIHTYINQTRKQLQEQNPEQTNFLILGREGKPIHPHSISRIINQERKPQDRKQPIKIRQSVIYNLLKNNNDIRIVQVFAGHRNSSCTEEYRQNHLEELKTGIQKYHPLQ
jgi:integrase/recombinase XerD